MDPELQWAIKKYIQEHLDIDVEISTDEGGEVSLRVRLAIEDEVFVEKEFHS